MCSDQNGGWKHIKPTPCSYSNTQGVICIRVEPCENNTVNSAISNFVLHKDVGHSCEFDFGSSWVTKDFESVDDIVK